MTTDLKVLTAYNLWANSRISNWLCANDSDKLDEECASSFSTIGLTINHIWDAQNFYLSVLKETTMTKEWDKTSLHAIEQLVAQSSEFMLYTSQLNEKALNEPRTIQTKVLSGTFSQAQLIHHTMNHSTFHRGQIITIGHQLNMSKAPATDLFHYLSELKNN